MDMGTAQKDAYLLSYELWAPKCIEELHFESESIEKSKRNRKRRSTVFFSGNRHVWWNRGRISSFIGVFGSVVRRRLKWETLLRSKPRKMGNRLFGMDGKGRNIFK